MLHRKIFRLATGLVSLALACQSPGAQAGWWLRVKPASLTGGSTGAAIQTITPSAAWNGTTSYTGRARPTIQRDLTSAVVSPYGQQTITGVAGVGGATVLEVASTANVYDGEWWVIRGTGGAADGYWQMQVLDATHVKPCNALAGNTGAYSCSAAPTYNAGTMAAGGTLNYVEQAVATFDDYPYSIITAGDGQTICVGAKQPATRSDIDHVDFWMEGGTATATAKSIGPSRGWPNGGNQGYCVKLASRASGTPTSGEVELCANVVPTVGWDRLYCQQFTLNTDGTLPQAVRYVDCLNGGDDKNGIPVGSTSETGTVGTGAWRTIQRGFQGNSSGIGGNLTLIKAPTEAVTLTTGANTGVDWPSASNKLQVGYTVVFQGNLPPQMVAGQAYYVIHRNFVAGQHFEISARPPGDGETAPLAPYGIPIDIPLVTSGTASGVTASATTCTDGNTAPTPVFVNARANTVRPAIPHSVTMTRPDRGNNADIGFTGNNDFRWYARANKAILSDVTVDDSKVQAISPDAHGIIALVNSRRILPEGSNPPLGISNVYPTAADGGYSSSRIAGGFAGTFGDDVVAVTETFFSTHHPAGAKFARNVSAVFSYDLLSPGLDANVSWWNVNGDKRGNYLTTLWPDAVAPTITIASKNVITNATYSNYFDNPDQYGRCNKAATIATRAYTGTVTEITLNNVAAMFKCNVPDARFIDYGANPSAWFVVGIDQPNKKIIVAGDASSVGIGDLAMAGVDAHSDMMQIIGSTTSTLTGGAAIFGNWYFQKYYVRWTYDDLNGGSNNGKYMGDSINGFLSQNGTTGGSGTLTITGASLVSSVDVFWKAGDLINLGGLGSHLTARVARTQPEGLTPAGTTIALEWPVRGVADGTQYTTWRKLNVGKDFAIVNSIMDARTGDFSNEAGDINWGWRNSTIIGGQFHTRDTAGAASLNFAMMDDIQSAYRLDGGTSLNGPLVDNSYAYRVGVGTGSGANPMQIGSNLGQNVSGTPLTFNLDTRDADPSMTKLLRPGLPITEPWDYLNRPRTPASRIGAYN